MEYVHGESFSRLPQARDPEGAGCRRHPAAVLSNVLHGLHRRTRRGTSARLDIVHRDVSRISSWHGPRASSTSASPCHLAPHHRQQHRRRASSLRSPEQTDGEKATRRDRRLRGDGRSGSIGRRLFSTAPTPRSWAITMGDPTAGCQPGRRHDDAVVRRGWRVIRPSASARDMALSSSMPCTATPTVVVMGRGAGGGGAGGSAEPGGGRTRIRPDEETTTDPTLRTEALVELPVTPVVTSVAPRRPPGRALMSRPLPDRRRKGDVAAGSCPSSRPPEVAVRALPWPRKPRGRARWAGRLGVVARRSDALRHLPTSSQAPPPVGSAPSLHPESFDREARQALLHPGESSRGRRVVRTLASAVAVLLGLTLLASPVLVRRWAIVTAAQHGIEMSIDHVELTRAGLRFVDVRASARDLLGRCTRRGSRSVHASFRVTIGRQPGRASRRPRDLSPRLPGSPNGTPWCPGPLRSLDELTSGRPLWRIRSERGPGCRQRAGRGKRTEGRPLGADFKIAPLVTVRANAGGTFGPWARRSSARG